MGLVDQIFEQAKLGTAVDPSANPFATGVQLGQQQQRIDIAKQELAMELGQAKLKQTLLQQEGEMNAGKLQLFLQQRQDTANATKAFAGLAAQVSPLLAAGQIDDAQGVLLAEGSQNAFLLNDPRFKALYDFTTKAQDAKLELLKAKGTGMAPSIVTLDNPIPGMPPVQVLRTGPNSAQVIDKPAAVTPSPAEKNFNRMDELQRALSAATASGDPIAIADAKRKLDTFATLATPPSETISFDPKTGALTITKGKQASDITSTTATRLQEGLQSAVANIDVANRLEPLISTETVGARAFAESWIKDRVLAQAFPELASNKRANAEALAAQLRSTAVQQLKSDGNISEKERAQILQAVPEINSPIDSPARARQLIQASRRMAAIRAVVAATKLKQPIPSVVARSLSTTELKRLVDTGVITKEQALATFDAASAPDNPQ